MNRFERSCTLLRHHPRLENLPVWNIVRPAYDALIAASAGRSGVARTINGSDPIRLHPRWRGLPERYEPEVWTTFMRDLREGDTVVDVGAFIGLYAVAAAKRVGARGRVFAFEPDPSSFAWLSRHAELNRVQPQMRLFQAAAGSREDQLHLSAGAHPESHLVGPGTAGAIPVKVVPLDSVLEGQRVDQLKIDVEGFEEKVLQGASGLLRDARRAPRLIGVEVHPYAWANTSTTGEALLQLLRDAGYRVSTGDGRPVREISAYGHVWASKA